MRKQDKHSIKRAAGAGVFCLALSAALGSAVAMAAVPHTFTNGEVADADEVNANFTYLHDRIEALAGAGIGTVVVDCDPGADGPSALQDAVNSAPAKGLNITVTGACGPVEIFARRNITIDGQGTTTISGGSAEIIPLDIAGSQVIIVKGVSVDATGAPEGIIVGASLALLENISVVNAFDVNLGVYTGAVAILAGVNSIGDDSDPTAIEVNENSLVLAEGSVTATASGNAMLLDQSSMLVQDSEEQAGNSVALNGRVDAIDFSILNMENGSINGTIVFADSNFTGYPASGQNVTLTGLVVAVRSRFLLLEENGGSTALDSGAVGVLVQGAGVTVLEGDLTFPETIPLPVFEAIETTRGLTVRDGAVAIIESGATLTNALNTFEVKSFSRFETNVTIDESRVTCTDASKVIAEDKSAGTDDLCVAD